MYLYSILRASSLIIIAAMDSARRHSTPTLLHWKVRKLCRANGHSHSLPRMSANSGSRNSKRFGAPCSVLCLDAHGQVRQATHIHWMPQQMCHHIIFWAIGRMFHVSTIMTKLVECSDEMVLWLALPHASPAKTTSLPNKRTTNLLTNCCEKRNRFRKIRVRLCWDNMLILPKTQARAHTQALCVQYSHVTDSAFKHQFIAEVVYTYLAF